MLTSDQDNAFVQRIAVPDKALPVLHLDSPLVELGWSHKGQLHYESVEVEGPGNEWLVAAAKQLIRTAKLGGQPVVLCLASPFFDNRQILLGDMPVEETLAILGRKAANGLGVDLQETLFWAQRCETPMEKSEAAQSTWLVHAQRRSDHHDLLLRMRREGILVRRTVAGRDVLTHALDDGEGHAGQILVTSTGRAVYAHLFRGHELVQESRLQLGEFENRDDTYGSVIQDVRQLAAFWAKGSRGAPLSAVHLVGFSEPEIQKMGAPLAIAAQGADVRVISSPRHDDFTDCRTQLLELLMAYGQRARNLSIPLPPRASRIALATVALSLFAAVGAWKMLEHWSIRIDDRMSRIEFELIGTDDVDAHDQIRSEYTRAKGSLQASIGSMQSLKGEGLPLEAVLRHVYGTLGRVVDIQHLTFEHTDEGTEILMEASLPDDVESAARSLEQLRRAARVDSKFKNIEVQPSSRVPDLRLGESLTFTFTGVYIGGDV
tara:strand:- start:327 stop:1796 length:1470 start_codon:yes stop_codon:yes gene_type:complete